MHTTTLKSGLIVCAALVTLGTWSSTVTARDRSSSVTGPNGHTASRQTVRSEGNVNSTATGPNGQTASRAVARTPQATEAVITLPNGQTVVRQTTRQP